METEILLASTLLPLYKLLRSGRVINENTVRVNGYITPYAIGHFFQGSIAGYLLGPAPIGIFAPYRKLLTILFLLFYPIYNIVKRVLKYKSNLFESSVFVNMNDFVLGLGIGYASSLIWCKHKTCSLENRLSKDYTKSLAITVLAVSFIPIILSEISIVKGIKVHFD